MKIIIAGYGFVGKAVANSLKETNDLVIVDPKYTDDKIIDHYDADGIVICVGTPSTPSTFKRLIRCSSYIVLIR